ncbi:carboxymuconolactone decarboxylase family protein [Salarchaeum sp. JOR-1]|uniref:carboxymuconolactone decarboxylase family protein n=1 Tax=Salarchaeum sp. JOR-1 TaxID=2599399 RepID=UPI0011989798|nr:carboxymuconolactone decarboxylase family protein [Salarchaeum sp. JOR-1]QDX41660.1 carboxymuconolactone decarboxylase family protein [Salarchaeum sp. JOR-1]
MDIRGEPRVPYVESREELPEPQREHYDRITASRDSVIGPFGVLLHSPVLAGRVADLGSYLRFESALPEGLRELAIVVSGREFDAAFEWAVHAPLAREAGVSEAALDAVVDDAPVDDIPADEGVVIRFGRELWRDHAVSEETYRAAADAFGVQGVVDLTALLGYYGLVACVLNAFEVLPAAETPL